MIVVGKSSGEREEFFMKELMEYFSCIFIIPVDRKMSISHLKSGEQVVFFVRNNGIALGEELLITLLLVGIVKLVSVVLG